jgi:hypothetical protein
MSCVPLYLRANEDSTALERVCIKIVRLRTGAEQGKVQLLRLFNGRVSAVNFTADTLGWQNEGKMKTRLKSFLSDDELIGSPTAGLPFS